MVNEDSELSSRKKVNRSVLEVSIAGMLLAMAVILDLVCTYIPGLSWPNGGTITLGMLPLFLTGLILGPFYGFAVSLLFGGFNILIGGAWAYNWCSILLDYVLGFTVCGICGFFRKEFYKKRLSTPIISIVLAGLLRFLCSFFSGCIVMWDLSSTGEIAPNFSPATVLYSTVYNLGYILPSIILSIIVFVIISKPLHQLLDGYRFESIRPEVSTKDGFLKENGLDSFLPFIFLILAFSSVLSMIPTLVYEAAQDVFVVDFTALSYVSLIAGFAFAVYTVVKYHLVSEEKRQPVVLKGWMEKTFRTHEIFYIVCIALFALVTALGVISMILHYAVYAPLV